MPDILIRGMEMPKGCKSCELSSDSHCNKTGEWLFSTDLLRSGFNWKTCRLENCPLHELPAHGDLIERDKALSHPFANGRYDHENANKHFIGGHESYKEWLEDLPVIVPASEEAQDD